MKIKFFYILHPPHIGKIPKPLLVFFDWHTLDLLFLWCSPLAAALFHCMKNTNFWVGLSLCILNVLLNAFSHRQTMSPSMSFGLCRPMPLNLRPCTRP